MRRLFIAAALSTVAALAAPVLAQDVSPTINRLIDEGVNHSQVMTIAEHLSDQIGPRLTGSPAAHRAEAWTQEQYRAWGLKNVHKEAFPFGRGWWIEHASARMIAPRPVDLVAIPIAWTPSTNGPVTAPVVLAPIKTAAEFAKWKGKLAGKIVLTSAPDTGSEPSEAAFRRLDAAEIGKLDTYQMPRDSNLSGALKRLSFAHDLAEFLKSEGAVAYVTESRSDGKLIHGEGYQYEAGDSPALPGFELAAEDYRRLARLSIAGVQPTLELNSVTHYDDSDPNAYNVIAEIPGADPRAGYVMAGAHLDSWTAGDGATDNGAGSAMVMEAARIIAATGIRPRRTIRFALWEGEEQGLLGSIAWTEAHLATRGDANEGKKTGFARYLGWGQDWPVTPRAGWGELAAYFNIDNGSGKLRGLYAEDNPAVVPIFHQWLAPFAAFGADNVVMRRTGSTDHWSMQQVGAPGFQFIQDPLDYESRTHHTSADTYDHLKADDMREGATILAALLVDAADADKPLPRTPIPTKAAKLDPFAYDAGE
jgi:carboxypeptidase Q